MSLSNCHTHTQFITGGESRVIRFFHYIRLFRAVFDHPARLSIPLELPTDYCQPAPTKRSDHYSPAAVRKSDKRGERTSIKRKKSNRLIPNSLIKIDPADRQRATFLHHAMERVIQPEAP